MLSFIAFSVYVIHYVRTVFNTLYRSRCVCDLGLWEILHLTCNILLVILSKEKAKDIFLTVILQFYIPEEKILNKNCLLFQDLLLIFLQLSCKWRPLPWKSARLPYYSWLFQITELRRWSSLQLHNIDPLSTKLYLSDLKNHFVTRSKPSLLRF